MSGSGEPRDTGCWKEETSGELAHKDLKSKDMRGKGRERANLQQ